MLLWLCFNNHNSVEWFSLSYIWSNLLLLIILQLVHEEMLSFCLEHLPDKRSGQFLLKLMERLPLALIKFILNFKTLFLGLLEWRDGKMESWWAFQASLDAKGWECQNQTNGMGETPFFSAKLSNACHCYHYVSWHWYYW